ncbi:MAG: hypothetical protein QOI05_779 [Bradyrhizobium sp.]|jgi:hypothetical protein|nr:hypothetical protein [Bradyrhizobium sp.]
MAQEKRRRGRPLGEGKKDGPYLAQVADLLVTDQSLKCPTAAMRRIVRSRNDWEASDGTLLRRWQCKWAKNRSAFMAEARKRNAPFPQPTNDPFAVGSQEALRIFSRSRFYEAMQNYLNSPAHHRLLSFMNSPSYRAQVEQMNKFAQLVQTDSYQKKIHELQKVAGAMLSGNLRIL